MMIRAFLTGPSVVLSRFEEEIQRPTRLATGPGFESRLGWDFSSPVTYIFLYVCDSWTVSAEFIGDFRCGALLFMVILVIYTYKNR